MLIKSCHYFLAAACIAGTLVYNPSQAAPTLINATDYPATGVRVVIRGVTINNIENSITHDLDADPHHAITINNLGAGEETELEIPVGFHNQLIAWLEEPTHDPLQRRVETFATANTQDDVAEQPPQNPFLRVGTMLNTPDGLGDAVFTLRLPIENSTIEVPQHQ